MVRIYLFFYKNERFSTDLENKGNNSAISQQDNRISNSNFIFLRRASFWEESGDILTCKIFQIHQ